MCYYFPHPLPTFAIKDTMKALPIKLDNNPIIEALFEIRFAGNVESLADILPGLLYPHVKHDFPKIEPLPTIPKEIVKNDLKLNYRPSHRLVGTNYSILLGESVFTLSSAPPYQGWPHFQSQIQTLLQVLKQTEVIESVERFSLKYVNLLPAELNQPELDMLKLKAELGTYDLKNHHCLIRTEINQDDFLNIINLIPQTKVVIQNTQEHLSGLLIDIDTIYEKCFTNFWEEIYPLLEKAHLIEKSIFFNVLKKETITQLKPIWSPQ
jgi:uncharacterized protein (TIGR04255 family)